MEDVGPENDTEDSFSLEAENNQSPDNSFSFIDENYEDLDEILRKIVNEDSDYESDDNFSLPEVDSFTLKGVQEFPDFFLDEGYYDDFLPIPIYKTTSRHSSYTGADVTCDVSINKLPIKAIIDTGAQFTVMATRMLKNMTIKPKPGKPIKLVGIADDSQKIGYWTKVKMEIGKLFFWTNIIVADIEPDLLLGNDWMKSAKIKLDFETNIMHINGYQMPISIESASNTINKDPSMKGDNIARAYRETVIPPSTCQPITLAVNENLTGDIIVESLPGSGHGLLVPAAIHHSYPYVHQLVYNYSEAEIRIPKGTPLALASECNRVTEFSSGDDISSPEVKARYIASETVNVESMIAEVPDHLQKLFKESAIGLTEQQCLELKDLLIENQDIFSRHDMDIGRCNLFKHPIPTGDARPFRDKMRRVPLKYMQREREHVRKLQEQGLIQHSTSPWAFNSVIVQKRAKEGTPAHEAPIRYALDYRELNRRTVFDAHPLPSIETLLQCVAGSNWMSSLDLTSGFWQLELEDADKHKTAFYCSLGLMEWVVTPFGLQNAPASFQRLMTLVLGELNYEIAACYIDDVVIFSKDTFQQHLINLKRVFRRLRKYNLKVKPDKCTLLRKSMKFLSQIGRAWTGPLNVEKV